MATKYNKHRVSKKAKVINRKRKTIRRKKTFSRKISRGGEWPINVSKMVHQFSTPGTGVVKAEAAGFSRAEREAAQKAIAAEKAAANAEVRRLAELKLSQKQAAKQVADARALAAKIRADREARRVAAMSPGGPLHRGRVVKENQRIVERIEAGVKDSVPVISSRFRTPQNPFKY